VRTAEVLKVLTDHGWAVLREDATHRILRKNGTKTNKSFYYHKKELSAVQVRQIAKNFNVKLDAFFAPRLLPSTEPVKLPESPQPGRVTKTVEGPITSGAELLFVPVKSLAVDHRYQRPLNAVWARELANNWRNELLGILTVSKRDGGFWILEGQHRVAALLSRGEGERKVPVLAFDKLTLKEEADIYLGRSTVRMQTSLALFQAKLTAEDPAAVDINRIVVELHKLKIGQSGNNSVAAIAALFELHAWGVLNSSFSIFGEAWGEKPDRGERARQPVLLALGAMVRYYGKLLDHKRLGLQLRPYTGRELIHMALSRVAAKAVRSSTPTYIVMVEVFRSLYNHRLKNPLPPADLTARKVRDWKKY
jgi:hypothetical protein